MPNMPERTRPHTHTHAHSPPPRPACSKAVRPGGLLVLELPHPSDLWGGYCLEDEQFVEAWDAQASPRARVRADGGGREASARSSMQQLAPAPALGRPQPLVPPARRAERGRQQDGAGGVGPRGRPV